MDPTATDPIVGCLLDGRYRVGRQVARGGMATVYQADDTRLQRTVAVKVMHAAFAEDVEFVRRFHREAHAAASLSHPNVVAMFDQGHDQETGAVYLTMEYVAGRTLRDLLAERGPLDPNTALGILDQVLDALTAAHRAGLIHRDVKPENILLGARGEIKVADFGLARAITTSTATQGKLIGTVSYLAPEQLIGGRTDARSDVYAAGVVLYEMLTGVKPHRGDTPIQVAYKHVNQDVAAPSEDVAGLPAFVDGLVLRSTARDPHVRPADASVLRHYVRRARTALEQRVDDPDLAEDLLAFRTPDGSSGQHTVIDTTDPALADRLNPAAEPTGPGSPGSTSKKSTPRQPPRRQGARSSGTEHTTVGPAMPLGTTSADRASEPRKTTVTRPRPGQQGRARAIGRSSNRAAGKGSGPDAGSGTRSGGRSRTSGGGSDNGRGFGAKGPGTKNSGTRSPNGRATSAGRGLPPRLSSQVMRRRRLLVLVLALLLIGSVGLGYWWGFARYTTVPELRELSGAELRQSARSADVRLRVADARVWHDKIPAGQVAKVSPGPGERLLRGETVEVVLSKGMERHRLPDLTGRDLADARAEVRKRNLELIAPKRVFRDAVPEGKVIAVEPEPGTVLVKGSSVRLVVSRGPAPVEVPSVTGKSLDAASDTLRELGLTVRDDTAYSEDVPEGRVVSQQPRPGEAHRGDTVELVVSKGPKFRELPDLTNTGAEEAEQQLRQLGFEVRVEQTDLYVGAQLVVGQSPAAGEKVRQGKTVTLEIV